MAGKVKKGFGAYMFILLLALVAAFLIVMLVMIFNPFKPIMGLQYVYYEDSQTYFNVTGGDTNEIFDLSALDEIKVNCNYAEVRVLRDFDAESNQIKIENKAKGFAGEKADVSYSASVYYQSGSSEKVLCIDVKEPDCSLYFSKYVVISIIFPKYSADDLENVKLNISNTDGNMLIGYGDNNAETLQIGALDIKTTNGSVTFGNILGSSMDSVFIKTQNGSVSGANLTTSQFSIISSAGNLNFTNLNVSGTCNMQLGDSMFKAQNITADVSLQIENGYFDANKLVGDISGNYSAEQMKNATITIKEVVGNVSFPFANNAKINIDKISGGKLYVRGTSGQVNVKSMQGYAWVELTNGSVDISSNSALEVVTTSGRINVSLTSQTLSKEATLTSTNGEINLGINSGLACILNAKNTAGENRTSNNVSIEGFDNGFELPLTLNGGTKNINMTTNAKINVYLLEEVA